MLTTIKPSFKLGINTTRLNNGWQELERQFRSATGGKVVLTGLDSEDKAKGVEGLISFYSMNLISSRKAEYDQTNLSLRVRGTRYSLLHGIR